MLTSNIQKHRGHPKVVIPTPRTSTGPGQHLGKVVCRLCDGAFVRWASKQEVEREVMENA